MAAKPAGMGISIRLKLSLWILALVIGTTAATSFLLVRKMTVPLSEEVTKRGLAIAGNLANAGANLLVLQNDLGLAATVADVVKGNPGVLYAALLDNSAWVLAHSDLSQAGRSYKNPPGLILVDDTHQEKEGWYLVEYQDPKTGPVLEVRAAMRYRGQQGDLGAAYVGLSKRVIGDAVRDARKNALIAGGGSALAGILAAFILAGFLARPIRILQRGASAVGEGNLDVIIPITTRDELGALAASFNDMSQKLKIAQRAQIEKEKMDQELAIANEVQQLLLPKRLPALPGYDIAAVYKAARTVGGDYYDVIPQGNKLHLVVGDVSGKGIPGLVGMTLARNAIRFSMGNENSPQKILTQANDLVFDDLAGTMFITVFHAVLSPQQKTLVCCNAGHHPLAIYRAGSKTVQRVGGEGLAFRMTRGAQFAAELKEEATILSSGDIALLYTDGANEAMDPDYKMFGEDRLEWAMIRYANLNADGFVKGILTEIETFRRGAEPNDDLTMVALKAL